MLGRDTSSKTRWIPLPRGEKAEELHNPYRGLYSLFRFYADDDKLQPNGAVIENVSISDKQQLCLIEINLINFNDKPISENALSIVGRILAHFTSLGKQMIVRFLYDWDGKAILSEPKDITIILNHMSKLSPLLKEYSKSIYILQGLFIGSWGEMHSSRYLSERHMVQLAKHLYECSGTLTQIALRCPSFWRMIFKTFHPLDEMTAFTQGQKARFALFNDGMMASISDYGTYGDISSINSKEYSDKWVRNDELEFQNKLCQYVSNGGEVINDCSYNDAEAAIKNLKTMRVSYLHGDYDKQVLEKWRASRADVASSLWQNKSAYEYIVAHLGYRFVIEDVVVTSDKSYNLMVKIKIRNKGFAPCYNKFNVKIVVRNPSFSESYEYKVDTDTRFWMPDTSVELQALISPRDWKGDNYILGLNIYDPRTEQNIQVANTFKTADYMGVYSLGNLLIT